MVFTTEVVYVVTTAKKGKAKKKKVKIKIKIKKASFKGSSLTCVTIQQNTLNH